MQMIIQFQIYVHAVKITSSLSITTDIQRAQLTNLCSYQTDSWCIVQMTKYQT